MSHEDLIQAALTAIKKVYYDDTVQVDQVIASLEELQEEIENLLFSLEEEGDIDE